MIIAYHAKNDKHGWHEVCRHPIDSPAWGKFDLSMIAEMIKNGHEVLTCGWNMYQIVREVR